MSNEIKILDHVPANCDECEFSVDVVDSSKNSCVFCLRKKDGVLKDCSPCPWRIEQDRPSLVENILASVVPYHQALSNFPAVVVGLIIKILKLVLPVDSFELLNEPPEPPERLPQDKVNSSMPLTKGRTHDNPR